MMISDSINLRRKMRHIDFIIVALFVAVVITYLKIPLLQQPVIHRKWMETENFTVKPKCSPHQHIFHCRIPKTGSSTLGNIMLRYILRHNISEGDIRTLHTTPYGYPKFLHNDTKFITILRDPRELARSMVLFFNTNPEKDKVLTTYERYLKVMDNETNVKEVADRLYQKFHLIMINEMYDEGLVLMKRMLCWDLKDIIYYSKKVQTYPTNFTVKLAARENDILLYKEIKDIFLSKISYENLFMEEVACFKEINLRTEQFCSHVLSELYDAILFRRDVSIRDILELAKTTISATPFNEQFTLTAEDCALMSLEILCILKIIRGEATATDGIVGISYDDYIKCIDVSVDSWSYNRTLQMTGFKILRQKKRESKANKK